MKKLSDHILVIAKSYQSHLYYSEIRRINDNGHKRVQYLCACTVYNITTQILRINMCYKQNKLQNILENYTCITERYELSIREVTKCLTRIVH